MYRQSALVLTILFFMCFWALAYYGARVTIWSSMNFSIFVSLILLNFFYPISQAVADVADITLGIYACILFIGIIILAIYITQSTLTDVRPSVLCDSIETC
jgi:flagellar biosynthesis component FlhA